MKSIATKIPILLSILLVTSTLIYSNSMVVLAAQDTISGIITGNNTSLSDMDNDGTAIGEEELFEKFEEEEEEEEEELQEKEENELEELQKEESIGLGDDTDHINLTDSKGTEEEDSSSSSSSSPSLSDSSNRTINEQGSDENTPLSTTPNDDIDVSSTKSPTASPTASPTLTFVGDKEEENLDEEGEKEDAIAIGSPPEEENISGGLNKNENKADDEDEDDLPVKRGHGSFLSHVVFLSAGLVVGLSITRAIRRKKRLYMMEQISSMEDRTTRHSHLDELYMDSDFL